MEEMNCQMIQLHVLSRVQPLVDNPSVTLLPLVVYCFVSLAGCYQPASILIYNCKNARLFESWVMTLHTVLCAWN